MALCLTFGGTPCPFEWGVISEAICDLATALMLHNNWNPDNIHAPNQENFPPPIFLPDSIPFKEGKKLIMNVSINTRGTHDIYIDNLISLGLDLPKCNNKKHLEAAPLLAIDACLQRVADNEPIPHHNMASLHKLSMEGRLEETKMILGWMWDFWQLTFPSPLINTRRGWHQYQE
jgi:hypothetical protein